MLTALIIELREQHTRDGLDADADSIAWHLEHHRTPAEFAAAFRSP